MNPGNGSKWPVPWRSGKQMRNGAGFVSGQLHSSCRIPVRHPDRALRACQETVHLRALRVDSKAVCKGRVELPGLGIMWSSPHKGDAIGSQSSLSAAMEELPYGLRRFCGALAEVASVASLFRPKRRRSGAVQIRTFSESVLTGDCNGLSRSGCARHCDAVCWPRDTCNGPTLSQTLTTVIRAGYASSLCLPPAR